MTVPLPDRLRLGPIIEAVDAHAAGEPGRVIVGGVDDVPGSTMFDKMTWLQANRDDLRLRMLREPRGYPAANCNLILPSNHPDAEAGYVIMEQVEYPGMSGTNTMCVVTVLLETGLLPMIEPVTELTLEIAGRDSSASARPAATARSPASRSATCRRSRPTSRPRSRCRSSARSPSTSRTAGCSTSSPMRSRSGSGSPRTRAPTSCAITEMIKAAANEQLPVVHPEQPGFAGITIGQLSGPAHDPANSRRNVVTVSTGTLDWDRPATWTGAIDRSPCGTGTSAKMATLAAKGELRLGEAFRHEGILGTVFTGRVVEETAMGPYRAVVPTITGQAWITGFASYVVDPTDPFPDGFTVGDIWA